MEQKIQVPDNHEVFLERDPEIPGQHYACFSFISPEKMLKQKSKFEMVSFLCDLLNNPDKLRRLIDPAGAGPLDQPPTLHRTTPVTYQEMDDLYYGYLLTNEAALQSQFDEQVDFQTNTRAVKIRGVYETEREAKKRAAATHKRDPYFNIYVGPVGVWLPWDPSEDAIAGQEHTSDHLNTMMKAYRKNMSEREEIFGKRHDQAVADAKTRNDELKRAQQAELNAGGVGAKPHTDISAEESKTRIGELRTVADEKDRLFQQYLAASKAGASSAGAGVGAGVSSAGAGVGSDGGGPADAPPLGGNRVSSQERTTLFESDDPWMQRRGAARPEPSEGVSKLTN